MARQREVEWLWRSVKYESVHLHAWNDPKRLVGRLVAGWNSTTASGRIGHWNAECPTMSTSPTGRHGEMWRKKQNRKFPLSHGVVKSTGAGVYLKSRVNLP